MAGHFSNQIDRVSVDFSRERVFRMRRTGARLAEGTPHVRVDRAEGERGLEDPSPLADVSPPQRANLAKTLNVLGLGVCAPEALHALASLGCAANADERLDPHPIPAGSVPASRIPLRVLLERLDRGWHVALHERRAGGVEPSAVSGNGFLAQRARQRCTWWRMIPRIHFSSVAISASYRGQASSAARRISCTRSGRSR